jgi:hypothetical protein
MINSGIEEHNVFDVVHQELNYSNMHFKVKSKSRLLPRTTDDSTLLKLPILTIITHNSWLTMPFPKNTIIPVLCNVRLAATVSIAL